MSPKWPTHCTSDLPMLDKTSAPLAPMPVSAVNAIEVDPVGAGVVTVGVGVAARARAVAVGESGEVVGSGVGVCGTNRTCRASMRRDFPVVPQVPPSRVHASHPRFCTWQRYSTRPHPAAVGTSRMRIASMRSDRPVVPATSPTPSCDAPTHGIQPMFWTCA
jgi:hypothetical protein